MVWRPHLSRPWKWVLGIVGGFILLVIALSYVVRSEYLRNYAERRMNRHLKGYTVEIGRAYFHPIGFALDLRNLTLVQQANPKPPVADIGRLLVSLSWRDLFTGHLVGDLLIERFKLYVNLKHVQKEEESKVPLKKKGWQDAVESIYPLKINNLKIRDGELTYVDEGPYKPLHATGIYVHARNIRNVHSPEHVYPSSFHLDATLFKDGKLTLDGHANFLQEPHVGLKGDMDLTKMDLAHFEPIAKRGNVTLKQGRLSAKGNLEYAPGTTVVHMKTIEIDGAKLDYLSGPETAPAKGEKLEKAAERVKEVSGKSTEQYRVDLLKVSGGSFGYLNKTTRPDFRLFIDSLEGSIKNLSNHLKEGEATVEFTGKFMGTGDTRVTGTFRPEKKSPDFDINVAIENTDMVPMSDLFRAYGNFDIKAGRFSLFCELSIRDGYIEGYVKPLFKDMKVTDRRHPKEKSLFQKLYVGLVGGLAKLLENRPRDQVATKAEISGPIGSAQTSTRQVVLNLIRNAFIKAILPGFEKEVGPPEK